MREEYIKQIDDFIEDLQEYKKTILKQEEDYNDLEELMIKWNYIVDKDPDDEDTEVELTTVDDL